MIPIIFLLSFLFAASPVSLKVNPKVGIIPLTLAITVTVEKNPDNRVLCLLWGKTGEEMGSSSCQDLDGSESPRTFSYPYKTLREPGEWFFIVQVGQVTGKIIRSKTEIVTVFGGV